MAQLVELQVYEPALTVDDATSAEDDLCELFGSLEVRPESARCTQAICSAVKREVAMEGEHCVVCLETHSDYKECED